VPVTRDFVLTYSVERCLRERKREREREREKERERKERVREIKVTQRG